MSKTKIEWAERVWNPVRGCSRVSEGCRRCYAERQAARFSGEGQPWNGFVRWQSQVSGLQYENRKAAGDADPIWTGRVELIESKLAEPLRWRKPSRVFVNSMSDLFHESLPDEAIAAVFGAMAAASWHTFIVLTKRAKRMREWFSWMASESASGRWPGWVHQCGSCSAFFGGWPLPNVWLGVSVEDQETSDARIPLLLATPAVKRFVSYEPALGPVDFREWLFTAREIASMDDQFIEPQESARSTKIDWLIVGGESGPGARPCDVAWIRSARDQCRAAGVPIFVKQFGARPVAHDRQDMGEDFFRSWDSFHAGEPLPIGGVTMRLRSRKGSDPSEWPEDLRVREWPESSR